MARRHLVVPRLQLFALVARALVAVRTLHRFLAAEGLACCLIPVGSP